MQRVAGRCMLSVHNASLPSDPIHPRAKQRSALTAHPEVRPVLALVWSIIPLIIVWAVVIYVLILKGVNGGLRGNNWSFFPTINFFGCSQHTFDASSTPTLNFGWGPPSIDSSSLYYDPYNDGHMNLFWTFAFISGLQIHLTLALHCAELVTTLSRDEAVWREATSLGAVPPPTVRSDCPVYSALFIQVIQLCKVVIYRYIVI
jgi:hypothetical protein